MINQVSVLEYRFFVTKSQFKTYNKRFNIYYICIKRRRYLQDGLQLFFLRIILQILFYSFHLFFYPIKTIKDNIGNKKPDYLIALFFSIHFPVFQHHHILSGKINYVAYVCHITHAKWRNKSLGDRDPEILIHSMACTGFCWRGFKPCGEYCLYLKWTTSKFVDAYLRLGLC